MTNRRPILVDGQDRLAVVLFGVFLIALAACAALLAVLLLT